MVDLRKLDKNRPEDRGFKNPPLHEQNLASRRADAVNRREVEDAAKAAGAAVTGVLNRNPTRRMQKAIRAGDKF